MLSIENMVWMMCCDEGSASIAVDCGKCEANVMNEAHV